MLKASQLVAFCLSMVGMPYWYGTCVYNCTTALRKRKANQYPTHYKSSRTAQYNSDIDKKLVCMDCVGMIKGFFWTNGGQGVHEAIGTGKTISNKYGGYGCPDTSASGMLRWCKKKGAKNGTSMSTLPDVPGVLLFSSGHVGVYVGGGYAVEARGFNYGVVKTKVSERGWTAWAYMPSSTLEYDTEEGQEVPDVTVPEVPKVDTEVIDNPQEPEIKLGDREIKRGVNGNDVAELQKILLTFGADLGKYGVNKDGIDGKCGTKTTNAIKEFQEKFGLTVDGKYGKVSHAKMKEVLSASDADEQMPFKIKTTASAVNVRTKPNTKTGDIMYRAKKGRVLTAVGVDAETGWYKLDDGYYISDNYTTKV